MAEEEKTETPSPAPKKSKTMLFVIIGVVVLALVGGGVAFFLMSGKKENASEELTPDAAQEEGLTPETAQEEDTLEEGEEALGAIFPLDPFVVNLNGGRFIRVQIQIEFIGRDIPSRVYGRIVPIRDVIITALTKKTADDILAEQGKDNLKKEIKDIVNQILKKEEVKRVYFTQIVVQ